MTRETTTIASAPAPQQMATGMTPPKTVYSPPKPDIAKKMNHVTVTTITLAKAPAAVDRRQ